MSSKKPIDVVVVGAGPVGLLAALQLAIRGVHVEIVDRDWRTSSHSYALALHPRTLEILDQLGLATSLLAQGKRVDEIAVYEGARLRTTISLARTHATFPFVLTLPQCDLEAALAERLRREGVRIHWNHTVKSLVPRDDGVAMTLVHRHRESLGYPIARLEWVEGKPFAWNASYVLGADGYDSAVRRAISSEYRDLGDARRFAVFEYETREPVGSDIRVILGDEGLSAFVPLSGAACRWIFQIPDAADHGLDVEDFYHFVTTRVKWSVPIPDEMRWSTVARFERRLAATFVRGPVLLAGDAAHLTGPIGAQSMNVGLEEATEAAWRLAHVLRGPGSRELLTGYEKTSRLEWERLLQLRDGSPALGGSGTWFTAHLPELLPCLPASGDDLDALLAALVEPPETSVVPERNAAS